MHGVLVIVVALTLSLISVSSESSERYYSLSAGAWLPRKTSNFQAADVSYDFGWCADGAIGVAFDNGLRLDNELTYRQAAAKGVPDDQWILGWVVNAFYDFRNSSPLTPYLMGGIGFGRGRTASPRDIDNSGAGAAYQVGGGFDFRLNQRLSVDLKYRFFGISDLTSGDGVGSFNPVGSSVIGGLRVRY